jgi:hypothetical protein
VIDKDQLKLDIIRPVLQEMDMWSPSAEVLLLGTCATESNLGEYIKQIKGPALGIYQMESTTYIDIWTNFLKYRPELVNRILKVCNYKEEPFAEELIYNLKLATIFARLQYYRQKESLPDHNNIYGLAKYYKKYYNTENGKGSVGKFLNDYDKYIKES